MWSINGKISNTSKGASIVWENHQFFTLEYQGRSYHGEILENNLENNRIKLKLNHAVYEVHKKGNLDDLIASLGMDKPKIKRIKELQAPMPGRILQLFVQVGQEVQVGDSILSLEAMKMENILKAEGIGKVSSINISEGDIVEKGSVLISFE